MKPTHAEVRLVHAQQHGGVRAGRPLVVGGAGAVRRPHLDEAGARAREHVRDAEAVADLDQLAAGHEHLAAFGERREREQHGGRVVVDDERGLGARQPAEDPRDVILARAAPSLGEVVLEVRVAAADLVHAFERGRRERCATEIRVRDDAGRVDGRAQTVRVRGGDLLGDERGQLARIAAGADLARARGRARRGRRRPRGRAGPTRAGGRAGARRPTGARSASRRKCRNELSQQRNERACRPRSDLEHVLGVDRLG